ncbi:MAG: GAF domain-containing sensor histidine kinase [Anaerolineaceae bacterium]
MTTTESLETPQVIDGIASLGSPAAPIAYEDEGRLAALQSYGILDTPREAAFDDITRMAMMICGTPVSLINLIDADRQWFKSAAGLVLGAMPFDSSICAHAVRDGDFFTVSDLKEDDRFANHPLVTGNPGIRFYAGAPLRTVEGHTLGMVCVLDVVARQLEISQMEALESLARQVMALLELRRTARLADLLLAESDRLNAALRQADASKDELLSMIAHELNSPLALIVGTVDGLQSGIIREEEDRLSAYSEIATSSRRLRNVVANMLALAPELGKKRDSELEPVLLQHSFDAAIAEHRHLHPASAVVLQVAHDLPPVCGERTYLDQMVTNLLSNAAKYGACDTPITISAKTWGSNVLVCVANEGPVMEPGNLERLFTPFYREATSRSLAPGVGLGLSVCRRLATALNGRIWAAARVGGGLEVNFTLPVVETPDDDA